jgi:DNA-binding response OmpR family regulator
LAMPKILLVEDDLVTCSAIRDWLEHERYAVEEAHSGSDALQMMRLFQYDVVILDLELPMMSGLDVLKNFRDRGGDVPVLILTGKRALAEKETGLDAGADDYLTKPFEMKELSARLRALMRRPRQMTQATIQIGSITLDSVNCRVLRDGQEIKLLPTEYTLLEFLMRHPNQLFSIKSLLDHVWKSESTATEHAVRTYIKRLRKKIDVQGQTSLITTTYGLGYKLENPKQ